MSSRMGTSCARTQAASQGAGQPTQGFSAGRREAAVFSLSNQMLRSIEAQSIFLQTELQGAFWHSVHLSISVRCSFLSNMLPSRFLKIGPKQPFEFVYIIT